MRNFDIRTYRQFRADGHTAQESIHHARAVEYAWLEDWYVNWEHDDQADLSFMTPRELEREHTTEAAILFDRDGNRLASLWGIVDADAGYRRLIEAELMDQAMPSYVQARLDLEDAS
jgi:hypothetical protein